MKFHDFNEFQESSARSSLAQGSLSQGTEGCGWGHDRSWSRVGWLRLPGPGLAEESLGTLWGFSGTP